MGFRGGPAALGSPLGTDVGASVEEAQPNKRLKLTGGDRSKGSGVLSAGGHRLSFSNSCAGARVARSLRAIR